MAENAESRNQLDGGEFVRVLDWLRDPVRLKGIQYGSLTLVKAAELASLQLGITVRATNVSHICRSAGIKHPRVEDRAGGVVSREDFERVQEALSQLEQRITRIENHITAPALPFKSGGPAAAVANNAGRAATIS